MASGLILTLLCVTGESSLWALALGTSLPVIALLSSLRTRPGGKVLAAGITAAGVIVWLIAGGAADAVEVIRALLLHFSGLTAALPLVARPFAALLGVTCGFIGYGLTSRRVGAYPALATVLLMALLLWLGNRPDALWGLLPAIIPCVALLMVSGYDEISVTRVLPLTLVVVLLSFLHQRARRVFHCLTGVLSSRADAAWRRGDPQRTPRSSRERQRANLPACRNQKFIHRQHVD